VFKDTFGRIQIRVFFSLGHRSSEVRHEIMRLHFFQLNVFASDDSDLRHAIIARVFIHPMHSEPTEFVLWQVSQDSRKCVTFRSTDLRNSVLVVLDEPLKVLDGLRALSVFNKVAHFFIFDLNEQVNCG
jgi:hypothetical protein